MHCKTCGKPLTCSDSVDRERGGTCYVAYLEKRVKDLERDATLQKALLQAIISRKERRQKP